MKKRIIALLLCAVMTGAALTGCGGGKQDDAGGGNAEAGTSNEEAAGEASEEGSTGNGDKLVVWTLANDLIDMGERYTEKTGVEVETVVIEPADYPTKVQTALLAKEKEPDIIVGEPQMLEEFYDLGFFANLDEMGAKDYEGQIVDYVWQVGQDSEGIQRAISYQITPAGFFYRRDIAQKVFGTDDPDEIGKLFADYPTILENAQVLKDAGYRIFASDVELSYFAGDTAWVIDDALNIDPSRVEYMDLCIDLYQKDLTAYAAQWSTPWFQAMSGPVPLLTAETQWGTDEMNIWDSESFNEATEGMETTEVFAYGLPAWGVMSIRDNAGDTAGKWGVCAGPAYGFSGGTFIGISDLSERKELAWDFIQFCTLNEETADWWIEKTEGDTVSLVSALEKHKDDANEVYGGEKLYALWMDLAKGIDYSKVTKYDKAIGDAWGAAISSIKTGEMTKKDAIENFYDVVESTFPELTVDRNAVPLE